MIRLIRVAALALLACTVAGTALAQDSLGKRVSLDLKAMGPAEAFKVLADAVGLTVTVDQAVTAPVDILVRNVTAKTALTTMCESIGCRWSVSGSTLVVTPALEIVVKAREGTAIKKSKIAADPNVRVQKNAKSVERIRVVLSQQLPADMKFESAPLTVVSERLSTALGLQVTITNADPAVRTLTADLSNHTLQSGLRLLGEQAGNQPLRIAIKAPAVEGSESPAIYIMFGGQKTVVVKKK
jgi:hypothetical protein